MRTLRLVAALLVLGGGLLVGARPIGPAPALGAFLEPAHGVWSLARAAASPAGPDASVPGLGAPVEVVYDERAVPHIFARSEEDAYRALGYVVARDRLFQLYVQTLGASGRITEIGGAQALGLDREMRNLGLPRAAEALAARIGDTSATVRTARAYADGVNAYIAAMPAAELPLEFRLLGKRPPKWEPLHSYLLVTRMGWTLANIANERRRTGAAAQVGVAAANALFPDDSPIVEPIQPNGQSAPRFDTSPLPPPGAPDSASRLLGAAVDTWLGSPLLARAEDEDAPWRASNNWAVMPKRSATGHALLAGDPHLDLTLPSIWYEAHLVVPGRLDVYGVTIPGLPAIVIGFNRDVAWTFTNTAADVVDYYVEAVDDDTHPTRHRVDGAWRPIEARVEVYRGQKGETIATDTVYYTFRGPMQRVRGPLALAALDRARRGKRSCGLPRGRARADRGASSRTRWRARSAPPRRTCSPPIAAVTSPSAPRGATRSGRRTARCRWTARRARTTGRAISLSRNGRRRSIPRRGFSRRPISSPSIRAHPPSGSAETSTHGARSASTRSCAPTARSPWTTCAASRPIRAARAPTSTCPTSSRPRSAWRSAARARTASCSRRPGASSTGGTAGTRRRTRAPCCSRRHCARRRCRHGTSSRARTAGGRVTPSSAVFSRLMHDSASAWWDDRSTPQVEDRDAILASSLVSAYLATRQRFGTPGDSGWRWSNVHKVNIPHLLRIPALSALDMPIDGGPGTLSPIAMGGSNGPSWRMVVELGPTLHAWTTYPGGQSGNPASPRYKDRIPQWLEGTLEAVHVPTRASELPAAQRSGTLTLRPAR